MASARRIGGDRGYISRVERGEVSPTFEWLGRALAAMGEELVLDVLVGEEANHLHAPLDRDPTGGQVVVEDFLGLGLGDEQQERVRSVVQAETEQPDADATRPQPRIGTMSAEEKLPTSQTADDLLDIPAFLRRQAN